jgi:hypothetical protein
MGLDPQKRLAKGNKASNVKNRVWCELVKLHTVHEKKPMKEFVGRERKTAQEKSKKLHPEAAWGLGDPLSAREGDLIIIGDEAVSAALSRYFCWKSEGTQLVAEFRVWLLPILFFRAQVLTRIDGLLTGAVQEFRGAQGL